MYRDIKNFTEQGVAQHGKSTDQFLYNERNQVKYETTVIY